MTEKREKGGYLREGGEGEEGGRERERRHWRGRVRQKRFMVCERESRGEFEETEASSLHYLIV